MTTIRLISATPNLSSGGVSTSSAERGGPSAYGPLKWVNDPGAPKVGRRPCARNLAADLQASDGILHHMSQFDFEATFGDDYLYFYADFSATSTTTPTPS